MFIVMNFKNVIFKLSSFFFFAIPIALNKTVHTVLSGSQGHFLDFSLVMKPVGTQVQREKALQVKLHLLCWQSSHDYTL